MEGLIDKIISNQIIQKQFEADDVSDLVELLITQRRNPYQAKSYLWVEFDGFIAASIKNMETRKKPFLIHKDRKIYFKNVYGCGYENLCGIQSGDVVRSSVIMTPTIACLLKLIDLKTIIVPLTKLTTNYHDQFLMQHVDFVIQRVNFSKDSTKKTMKLIN